MPEGDTVWRTARRLHQALAGQPLSLADLRWPQISTVDLRGAVTLEIVARGKHLLHRLDSNVSIHSHLKMEGQWRVEASPALTARMLGNPQLRAVLGTTEWTALGLRLGDLHVVPTTEEHTLVGHLGPDVLGPDWNPDEAVRRISASSATIGAALLDQRNLAGVGTMYAAEVLFIERVNPWTPAAGLGTTQLAGLVERVHRLLDVGRRGGHQSTTGRTRRGETHFVHARSGRPCRHCGGTVRVAMIGDPPRDRTMFYCPTCQAGLAPTDTGRPQRPLGSSGYDPSRS